MGYFLCLFAARLEDAQKQGNGSGAQGEVRTAAHARFVTAHLSSGIMNACRAIDLRFFVLACLSAVSKLKLRVTEHDLFS